MYILMDDDIIDVGSLLQKYFKVAFVVADSKKEESYLGESLEQRYTVMLRVSDFDLNLYETVNKKYAVAVKERLLHAVADRKPCFHMLKEIKDAIEETDCFAEEGGSTYAG